MRKTGENYDDGWLEYLHVMGERQLRKAMKQYELTEDELVWEWDERATPDGYPTGRYVPRKDYED